MESQPNNNIQTSFGEIDQTSIQKTQKNSETIKKMTLNSKPSKTKSIKNKVIFSLLTAYSGILTLLSGIILLFYGKGLESIGIQILWIEDTFLGLGEFEWLVLHVIFGLMFSLIGTIHFLYNWKIFQKYYTNYNIKRRNRMITSSILATTFLAGVITGMVYYLSHGIKEIPINYAGILTIQSLVENQENYLESTELLTSFFASGGRGMHGNGEFGSLVTLHTIISLIFLGAAIMHIVLNRYPLKAYFGVKQLKKDQNSELKKKFHLNYRWELIISTSLILGIFLCCIFYLPPVNWLIQLVSS